MQKPVICLTGTIAPNTTLVARSDVAARLADYKKCVAFYLAETDLQVYFLENSEYDLSGDEDFQAFLQNPQFELVRFKTHPDTTKGKGFQEFYMLDQFVERRLKATYLIKITGRYIVENIASLISEMKAPLHIDLHRKMKVAITGCFGMSARAYRQYFTGLYTDAHDPEGRYIEHVLYEKIANSELQNDCKLMPQNVKYHGVSGSYGQSLARNKYKMMARGLERKINRSLGIREFLMEY
jgi:hypothetical protein